MDKELLDALDQWEQTPNNTALAYRIADLLLAHEQARRRMLVGDVSKPIERPGRERE